MARRGRERRLNRLVLGGRARPAGKVAILHRYAKYLADQVDVQPELHRRHARRRRRIAATLVDLFEAQFDPDASGDSAERTGALAEKYRRGVARRHEPRRGPHPLELPASDPSDAAHELLPSATPPAAAKPYMSFKLDPALVPDLPLPRPMYEVWVYSPRAEGVHLRGGRIAREGIRWSDRREDFRTEILGLMKAQMVKNAVIVPVGAKGGFVVKRPPAIADRDALQGEVEACYQILIRGLLDITDNIVGTEVVSPQHRRPLRRRRSLSRGRHGQGDGDVLGSSRTRSRRSTTSGWVTGSPRVVPPDTTARWGARLAGVESVRRHFLGLGINPTPTRHLVGIGDMYR